MFFVTSVWPQGVTQHFARIFSLFALVFRTSNFWSLRNVIKQLLYSRLLDWCETGYSQLDITRLVGYLPGPSRRLAPDIKCRKFRFFNVTLLGIYRWLEIYRWLVTFRSVCWRSLAHWNLIRHFEKHEAWRTVKRKIILWLFGERHGPQPSRCTSLWAKI